MRKCQPDYDASTPGSTGFPQDGIGSLRSLAGAFQFSGDDADKKIRSLSGGEKSSLAMAHMLIDALKNFEGTVIFVSHDRTFLRGLGSRVVELGGESGRDRDASHAPRTVR